MEMGLFWCRGPESNRYGSLVPRDFLTRYSFRCPDRRVWGLDFLFALSRTARYGDLGRGRQVSTLSRTSIVGRVACRLDPGLARDCSHPDVLLVPRI